jgi:hypothetical protein
MTPTWYEAYVRQHVGFVIETRHGKFLPMIGRCHESDGDDDCFIEVVAKNELQDTVGAALALLDAEKEKLHRVFRRPIKGGGGFIWLVVLVTVEEGDPRKKVAS